MTALLDSFDYAFMTCLQKLFEASPQFGTELSKLPEEDVAQLVVTHENTKLRLCTKSFRGADPCCLLNMRTTGLTFESYELISAFLDYIRAWPITDCLSTYRKVTHENTAQEAPKNIDPVYVSLTLHQDLRESLEKMLSSLLEFIWFFKENEFSWIEDSATITALANYEKKSSQRIKKFVTWRTQKRWLNNKFGGNFQIRGTVNDCKIRVQLMEEAADSDLLTYHYNLHVDDKKVVLPTHKVRNLSLCTTNGFEVYKDAMLDALNG